MSSRLEHIARLEATIRTAHDGIHKLQSTCQHQWSPSIPGSPDASIPKCVECGLKKDGWWCPKSPTCECDYYHDGRNGRVFNSHMCRYCGQPEERK